MCRIHLDCANYYDSVILSICYQLKPTGYFVKWYVPCYWKYVDVKTKLTVRIFLASEAMTVDRVSAYMKWWGACEDANNMCYRKYAIEVAYCVSIVLAIAVLLLTFVCKVIKSH